jgi:AhpD family alkylhydroperoxidase
MVNTLRERLMPTPRYVQPVPYHAATGLTAGVYRQMEADFQLAPLVMLHSPVPTVMAGVWSVLRESLLSGQADRTRKEVVAAAVSQLNACPFCVDAHTMMLHATADHALADVMRQGQYEHIDDQQLRALVTWLLADRRSHTCSEGSALWAGVDGAELVGTAVAFHYINRMVNVFLGDTLLPVPAALKGLVGRFVGTAMGKDLVRRIEPGASLAFLPPATLPDDLAWAAMSPAVAGAFAGLAAAVEAAGVVALPEPVRALVEAQLEAWDGEAPGLSRRWLEGAVVDLRPGHRAAARLALLTALASYQVDASLVEAFQAQEPEQGSLIAVTAWASFAAARLAGRRLAASLQAPVERAHR